MIKFFMWLIKSIAIFTATLFLIILLLKNYEEKTQDPNAYKVLSKADDVFENFGSIVYSITQSVITQEKPYKPENYFINCKKSLKDGKVRYKSVSCSVSFTVKQCSPPGWSCR